MDARLDKAFFQNLVKYNEQPFGELVATNFFELDFSPIMALLKKHSAHYVKNCIRTYCKSIASTTNPFGRWK